MFSFETYVSAQRCCCSCKCLTLSVLRVLQGYQLEIATQETTNIPYLSSKSHTAGGGAGFYGDSRRSLDSRGGTTPVSAKSFRNGGRGGLFKPGYTNYSGGNWINGGFGGGGSGSWGGTGGAGGYSGGGGDPNSGFGGGGGSFCQPGTDGNPTDAANGCSCSWGSGTWTSSDTYINGAGNDHLGKVEITFISS